MIALSGFIVAVEQNDADTKRACALSINSILRLRFRFFTFIIRLSALMH